MIAKKIVSSTLLGLFICLGHWLARGILVYAFYEAPEAIRLVDRDDHKATHQVSEERQQNPRGGDNITTQKRTAEEKVRLFLDLSFPNDFWDALILVALLVSVFCAMVLNSYFPDEYRDLGRKEIHTAIVQSVVPALQVLAAVVACATVEHNLTIHIYATAFYLWLFIVWDVAILLPGTWLLPAKPGKRGEDFQKKVGGYLLRIDVPAAVPFLLLWFIVRYWHPSGEDSSEHFVAGVLCAQACAALIAVGAVMWEDRTERQKQGAKGAAGGPAVPPTKLLTPGRLAALVLLTLVVLVRGRPYGDRGPT